MSVRSTEEAVAHLAEVLEVELGHFPMTTAVSSQKSQGGQLVEPIEL